MLLMAVLSVFLGALPQMAGEVVHWVTGPLSVL